MSGRLPPVAERAFCAALVRILEARHPEFAFQVGPVPAAANVDDRAGPTVDETGQSNEEATHHAQ